ncbi:TetR/AcrR family transcriptional regulator [Microvirga sp. VF16]|uniref:TetR/AcrR family transcriptional regulator n=1 Tax=Microvirga sp. VF16 TaxID=2807101 RepID=UPI00193D8150|nr:TetR/AcrR family transcriptional regulator [Microvirga sp. VF16]QRM35913.1 helix-turn-helix transcriptional regulator [Microvirga sp. VF16]
MTRAMQPVQRGRGRPRKSEISPHDGILQAASRAFAQGGYDGTNLRRIAADAGIDVALIAHHFGSKLDLWKAAVDSLATRLLTTYEDGPAATTDADVADRVRYALRHLIRVNSDLPELGLLVSQEMHQAGERRDYLYERLVRPHHDLLVPLIREAIAAGVIRQQDPEMLFFLLVTSISTSSALRPLIARFSEVAGSRERFQDALEQSVMANVLTL